MQLNPNLVRFPFLFIFCYVFFFLFLFVSFYFALFSLVYLISLRFISLGTGRQEFSVRATFSLKVYKFIMKEQKKQCSLGFGRSPSRKKAKHLLTALISILKSMLKTRKLILNGKVLDQTPKAGSGAISVCFPPYTPHDFSVTIFAAHNFRISLVNLQEESRIF